MGSHWKRRRHPDDVPTPIAVAVSDFCRRANQPASAAEVRAALAHLSEDDDFRVRAIADAEPVASPLGPFALVDLLSGCTPQLAAQRQRCGYYELAQELAEAYEAQVPPPPAQDAGPLRFAPPAAPRSEVPPLPPRRDEGLTMAERIAPRKRTSQEQEAGQSLADEEQVPLFLKRDLPKPRGRFTRLAAPRTPFAELLRVGGKELLEEALQKHEHRFALLATLAEQYNAPRGLDLALVDVESALEHHGLLAPLGEKEASLVLAALGDHRGALGRVAWALALSPTELQQLVEKLDLKKQVEEVRERFRREALSTPHLTTRLDLLGREKYLVDLGIKKRFVESLRKELETLVQADLAEADDLSSLAERMSRRHAAPSDLLLRAFERLGLSESLRKKVAPSSSTPTP